MTNTATPSATSCPTTIEPEDREHWLTLRQADVTSTDSAALLGVSPYRTALDVYLDKTGKGTPAFTDSERMFWGRVLEPAVAEGLAQRYGLTVRPITEYMRSANVDRLGASFDYEIVDVDPLAAAPEVAETAATLAALHAEHGPGILEIKTVDYLQYRDTWLVHDSGEVEASPHIEVQVQHQLAVSGRGWAAIGVLVAGNSSLLVTRTRHAEAISAIEAAASAFWAQVDAGTPPAVDGHRDERTISLLYPVSDPAAELPAEVADEAATLCADITRLKAEEKATATAIGDRQARLKELLADVERARVDGFEVTYKTQTRKAHTRQVPESTTRPLRIKALTAKPAEAAA
jgi:putative phage-type endonuclease